MFHKILVALDRSDAHQQVLKAALMLAQAENAALHLLHVLTPEEETAPRMPDFSNRDVLLGQEERLLETYHEQWRVYEATNLEWLRSLSQDVSAANVPVEFTQQVGNPGRTICELAQESAADLIVMGRRGYTGWKEFFLGSVSNYVLHHSSCSVFIVHSQPVASSAGTADRTQVELAS